MINWGDFENEVIQRLGRDISVQSNPEQNAAIRAPQNRFLFIAAGPGSGKTTVITLRVLKLIFVDGIDPSGILVTTFTRKAAAELRSRILGWGDQLKRAFLANRSYTSIRNQLRSINLNNVITGTLDSIAEEILGDYRAPGTPPPTVIEDFVSNALMIRFGLFEHGRFRNQDLEDYIVQLRGTRFGLSVSEKSAIVRDIRDRFSHDQIDVTQYRNQSQHSGIPVVCDAIDDYNQELQNRLLFDFARLEHEFLTKLQSGALSEFLQDIKFVLVDEYQDTNLLQEQIYFELARAALRNGGSLTVVGDDDQSLYRFRGATVDLFQGFPNRLNRQLNTNQTTIYLSRNYRSTRRIVDFCNEFITLDTGFQNTRVAGKPSIVTARTTTSQHYVNYPVLGMFRDDVGTLANHLSRFIHGAIHGGGVQIPDGGNRYTVRIDPNRGSPADIALLCSSPRELSASGNPRLPLLLRQELGQLSPPIQVFNPRGQHLQTIPDVQRLCGLMLECVDPGRRIQNSIGNLPQVATATFNSWRMQAQRFVRTNPPPRRPRRLQQFVNAWQNRSPLGRRSWKREVSLIELIYNLITWIPNMQNDIEGLVYLEAITRTISQAALFGNFGAEIIFDPNSPNLEQASIRESLWNIFVPIATGAIQIDEDLLETLPSDRINIMSIHQAKGLEFPLVIVDIGSDFRTSHHAHAFKRFPRNCGEACNMEDELRPFSPLGQPQRLGLDRAFDDLIRQCLVAYSRAQDVLLLVGLNSVKNYIRNIATGWDRNGNWRWGRGLSNLVHI